MLKNVFGEIGLEKTLQKIGYHLAAIASTISKLYPDTAGRMRVNIETGTVTVGNVASVGGYGAQYDQYSLIQGNANAIRAQIKVTP